MISSFYAGVAGGLMAHHSRILFPDAFTLLVAIDYLAMIIIGGMGSILGSIFGAVFMTLLPEVLKLGADVAHRRLSRTPSGSSRRRATSSSAWPSSSS